MNQADTSKAALLVLGAPQWFTSGVPWHACTPGTQARLTDTGTRFPWLGGVLSCCFCCRFIELLLETAHGQFQNPCCVAKAFGTCLSGSDGAAELGLSLLLSGAAG